MARWVLAVALACAGCGVASSSDAAPVTPPSPPTASTATVTGADGVASTVDDTSRIVTLSGDLTETLWELGLGGSIVAVDVTTVHPPEALELPVIGVGRFLNAEAVLAESPTLVIGDTQTSPLDAIEQIRSAGVPVLIVEVPTTFEALYDKIAFLAGALGVPDEGAALVERITAELHAAVGAPAQLEPPPRVAFIYSRGPDVMLLFGEGMTTRPLIEAAGGVDVGAASGVAGTVPVTPEALVSAAPDVIITTVEGAAALGGIDGLLSVPGVTETPAGRDGRILTYPEGDILTFGPRIVSTLEQLITDLRTATASE